MIGTLLILAVVLVGCDEGFPLPSPTVSPPAEPEPYHAEVTPEMARFYGESEPPAFPPEAGQDLRVFLALVASGGLSWFIGASLSYIFEEIERYQALAPQVKRWISVTASVGLPILALALLQSLPDGFFDAVNPYWGTLVTAVVGLVGNKYTYRAVVKPQRPLADDVLNCGI